MKSINIKLLFISSVVILLVLNSTIVNLKNTRKPVNNNEENDDIKNSAPVIKKKVQSKIMGESPILKEEKDTKEEEEAKDDEDEEEEVHKKDIINKTPVTKKKFQSLNKGESPIERKPEVVEVEEEEEVKKEESDSDFIRKHYVTTLEMRTLEKINDNKYIKSNELFIPFPMDKLSEITNKKEFSLEIGSTYQYFKCFFNVNTGNLSLTLNRKKLDTKKHRTKNNKKKQRKFNKPLTIVMNYMDFQAFLVKMLKEKSKKGNQKKPKDYHPFTSLFMNWISSIANKYHSGKYADDIVIKNPFKQMYKDYQNGYDVDTMIMMMRRILNNYYK